MNSPRKRARELGISPGVLPTGKWNAITDVAGVKVGHVSLIEGDDVRARGLRSSHTLDGRMEAAEGPGPTRN